MSILRPISIFLRNFLVKQHPYFSCCASCGEIKTPLGSRLCASLSPVFPIDAIILQPVSGSADEAVLLASLKKNVAWIRKIFILDEEISQPSADDGPNVFRVPEKHIFARDENNFRSTVEARLHTLPGLGEYYLVVTGKDLPDAPLDPLDFYTPNGLPLISSLNITGIPNQISLDPNRVELLLEYLLQARHPGKNCSFYAHTKQDSKDFLDFYRLYIEQADAARIPPMHYNFALYHWLFVMSRGLVVPSTV